MREGRRGQNLVLLAGAYREREAGCDMAKVLAIGGARYEREERCNTAKVPKSSAWEASFFMDRKGIFLLTFGA